MPRGSPGPGTCPHAAQSTAFNVDVAYALRLLWSACSCVEAAGMGADVYMKQSNRDLEGYTLAAMRKEFSKKTGQPPAA